MMKSKIHFSEKQRFNQLWLWVPIIIGVFVTLFIINTENTNSTALLITISSLAFVIIIFVIIKLETIIKDDGIYLRFFPFHLKFKKFDWNIIQKSYVRKYNPISEYGGWGIRISFSEKGNAYNISGNKGLQLEFNNNKRLLIGTNKPDELNDVLKKIGKL